MKPKIVNTTDFDIKAVQNIIRGFDLDISGKYDVMLKNGTHIVGRAYYRGSGYHSTANPFVVCRIPRKGFPRIQHTYQYAQLKGKRYWLANRMEALVYLLAHELRHIWQSQRKTRFGYAYGSKGRFSEVDTESFAIHQLRKYRKEH